MCAKFNDVMSCLVFDNYQNTAQRKDAVTKCTVINVTKQKGRFGRPFYGVCFLYFFAGAAGAAGFALPAPSTGSTLINSTSKIKAELPGILF
jgi:hypothetical protein